MDAIFQRISVRKYQNKKVEREKITRLLQAAMAAPSACNQQPWEFYVTEDSQKIAALSACSRDASCMKDAPLAIVACYRKTGVRYPELCEIDLSAAVQNMLLEAHYLGLGAVWLGIAPLRHRMDNVRQELGLPENLEAFCFVSCGYPAEERPPQNRYQEAKIHWLE